MSPSSQEVFGSNRVFFSILKVLGLASYDLDRSGKLKTGLKNYAWFLGTLIFWSGMCWLQLERLKRISMKSGIQSKILDHLWRYQYLLQHFIAVFVIIHNFTLRNSVENFLEKVKEFDKLAKNFNWVDRSLRLRPTLIALLLICSLVIVSTYYLISHYLFIFSDERELTLVKSLQIVANVFVIEFFLMLSLQFIFATQCIISKITLLSDKIRFNIVHNEICILL